jgi:hypothetical protein
MASVAVVVVAAVILGSQLAWVIGSGRPGIIPGGTSGPESPAPSEPVGGNCATSGSGAAFDPGTPEEDFAVLDGLPRVLTERHATPVVSLFASRSGEGQASVLCMWFTEQSPPVVASGTGIGPEFPADGPLRLFAASQGASPDDSHTAYAGSADPSIVRVEVERNEGVPVTASVADGYFLASWPGDALRRSLRRGRSQRRRHHHDRQQRVGLQSCGWTVIRGLKRADNSALFAPPSTLAATAHPPG